MDGRIVVDTNVLWDHGCLGRLLASDHEVIVPAVAFLERARQFHQRGWTVESLSAMLAANGFEVEELAVADALPLGIALDDAAWKRLARDALIASHVGPDDVLWTKNPRDFIAVGLPKGQVLAI